MAFVLGFSLCLNIIFTIISIFIYKNYNKTSPIALNKKLENMSDFLGCFDVKDINL